MTEDIPPAATPSASSSPGGAASDAGAKSRSKHDKGSIWDVYYPRNIDGDLESVPIASFPMIIYFWPSIVVLLLAGCFQSWGWTSDVTAGWWVTASLAFNLMVIVTDLDQKKFLIVSLLVILGAVGLWISHDKDVALISTISGWIGAMRPTYGNHTLFLLFSILFFFLGIGLLNPRLNYWKFEPNEFVHYIQPWGRDQSIPRQGSTVSREVPDVLELLLTFGGGTLVIKRESQVVARIQHVPFLGRRMRALEKMLGVTRVQVEN